MDNQNNAMVVEDRRPHTHSPLSADEQIYTAVKFLKPEHLAREPELYSSCWPAYAVNSPIRRDAKFVEAYNEAFKMHLREHVDYRLAVSALGINPTQIIAPKRASGDLAKGGLLTSVDNARQVADSYGLPYRQFIKFCFDFAANRGVRRIPRPHQLVPGKFRKIWERKLVEWKNDHFKVGMTSDLRRELAAGRSEERGCFGIPNAFSGASASCGICPLRDTCEASCIERIASITKREASTGTFETYEGYENFKRDKRRKANTERMRRSRYLAKVGAPETAAASTAV